MSKCKNPFLRRIGRHDTRNRETGNVFNSSVKPIESLTGLKRWLALSLGFFFVGLAVIGMVLPLVPTTPFLILASRYFVRSSPELQMRLMRMPIWGPMLRDWEMHRAVRPQAKRFAFALIVFATVFSVIACQLSWPLVALLSTLAATGFIVVWRLPVIHPEEQLRDVAEARNDGSLDRIGILLNDFHARHEGIPSPRSPAGNVQEINRLS